MCDEATVRRCGSCVKFAGRQGESHCTGDGRHVRRTDVACGSHIQKKTKKRKSYQHHVEEWSAHQDAILIKLNAMGRSMLYISQEVNMGCDECQARLRKLGIERKKVSPMSYAAEVAERQRLEELAKKKLAAEQEERRKKELAEKIRKQQREERMKKYQEWPKDQRTASYSQKPCSGQCCVRKEICQHYQSWVEHGSIGYKGLVIQPVEGCINYWRDGITMAFFQFDPLPGYTKEDAPVYAVTF